MPELTSDPPSIVLDSSTPARQRESRRSTLYSSAATDARRQLGLPTTPSRIPFDSSFQQSYDGSSGDGEGNDVADSESSKPSAKHKSPKSVLIDGRVMRVKKRVDKSLNPQPRLWDKEKRADLDPKTRQAFQQAAIQLVLPEDNKLSVHPLLRNSDSKLQLVHDLRSQLLTLKEHLLTYDIGDVFTVVSPLDVDRSGAVEPTSFDLLRDYMILHPVQVALSNRWYSDWIDETYVRENLSLTYQFLKSNTDAALWSLCLDEYDQYPPNCQGGPLMFILTLKRIQDSSEAAIEYLLKTVRNLKISALPGEDVEKAVTLVRATYSLLLDSSTEDRDYVPQTFQQTVLHVFQTTSVSRFNAAFAAEEHDAQVYAYKHGGIPVFPTVEESLRLATNMFRAMKDEWKPASDCATSNRNNVPGPPLRPAVRAVEVPEPVDAASNSGTDQDSVPEETPQLPSEQAPVDDATASTSAPDPAPLNPDGLFHADAIMDRLSRY